MDLPGTLGAPTLAVDLRRRDVPVAEELLDLHDVDAGVEQQRCRRRPERVRRVRQVPRALCRPGPGRA